jgi:hypothetical protein
MSKPIENPPADAIDVGGALPAELVTRERFVAELARAIDGARAGGRAPSVVVVRAADHPKRALSNWAALVQRLVRPGDRLTALGANELAVLQPGADREAAAETALLIVTHDLDDPPLLCGFASFPEAGASAEGLLAAAREAAGRARLDAPTQGAPA